MLSLLKSTFFTLILSSFVFITANAQTGGITLQVMPEFPRPNSLVTIQAASSATDLDTATFTWYVNGKTFKKGKGLTSIDITTGKAGVSTRVSVDVSTQNAGVISSSVSVKTAEVSLLWKSDGYIPPFYKGKALETYGSEFTVTAIPEFFTTTGVRINPKTLVYTWKKNGTVDPNQSGYGKDMYKEKQTSFTRGEDEISVLVSTATDDLNSGATIKLVPGVAEILFYENSPLYGILYETALKDSFFLSSEEVTLRASLFDISTSGTENGRISIDWSMNGVNVPEFANKKEVILRNVENTGGQTAIQLRVQHQDKILQGGQANITIFQ